jgi:excisionase family DNA binding protein
MQPSDVPSRAVKPLAARQSASRPRPNGALTTTEAAAFLGVSERTLRRYLALGLLPYGRLPGGHYRLLEETLMEFLTRRGSKDA